MTYIQITIETGGDNALHESLIALLADIGFDGFEETEEALSAFVAEADYPESDLNNIINKLNLTYTKSIIENQNWNQIWEQSYAPVLVHHPVDQRPWIHIRADFHPSRSDVDQEWLVTPKMSFGTGHHETTCLMLEYLGLTELQGKNVLDLGTGTGILAIGASRFGASRVVAIDNEPWTVENCRENCAANHCNNIQVLLGENLQEITETFDLILANINLNILIRLMDEMTEKLNADGTIVMSGILEADIPLLDEKMRQRSFRLHSVRKKGNWVAIRFHAQPVHN
jgi:ribosomal protein L11 methyltransferase